MTPKELFDTVSRLGVELVAEAANGVRYRAPRGVLTPELARAIVDLKPALVPFLPRRCAGCGAPRMRAILTELLGALYCPLCLYERTLTQLGADWPPFLPDLGRRAVAAAPTGCVACQHATTWAMYGSGAFCQSCALVVAKRNVVATTPDANQHRAGNGRAPTAGGEEDSADAIAPAPGLIAGDRNGR